MDIKTGSYSSCLLYLKDNHGFTEEDLSNLLGVSQEVVNFFVDPEKINKLEILSDVLIKEGCL